MKRLVGGDYLLDLSSIEIEESVDGTTKTNITDSDVLEQLTNLKKYVKNPEMAKPVWVKLKNGENDELVIARGTFAVVDTGEFEICVQLDGYKLVIFIEFTQVLNSDDVPMEDWYIDTNDAKYLFTSDAQNIGAITELPIFENIVDAQGHKRFIEGDGVPANDTNINVTYCKWSLSGSHLMLVLAGSIANETTVPAGTYAQFNLPEWIRNKIYPVFAGTRLEIKEVPLYGDDWSTEEHYPFAIALTKNNDGLAFINVNYPAVTTAERFFRVQFDLLIDNEQPVSQG